MLLTHIHGLHRVATGGETHKRGAAMADTALLSDAWVRIREGKIAAIGSMSEPPTPEPGEETINCSGRLVLPGFVDSHTHLVFPATREHEFLMKLQGKSYEEIARAGGGILNSAEKLATISEDELLDLALSRLEAMLKTGTTTVEIKSGYGLTLEGELKQLRVARKLQKYSPATIRTTFLGAHAIPAAYKTNREGYLDLVCNEILPRVADEGLADHIDVFCETIAFTPEETRRVVEAGAKHKLPAKIHANQLAYSGGVQTGVAAGAWSVDHLEHCGPAEIEALRGTDTVPVLLPSCSFFLREPYGPARDLIAADLPVCLATDYNPGSSPGSDMTFVLSLASIYLRMLPEEALTAATLNGAFALRLSDRVGSIEIGKQADLIITKPMQSLARLSYGFSENLVEKVICKGKII